MVQQIGPDQKVYAVDPALLGTESDVEQKFLFPFFASQAGLNYPTQWIHTKEYLRPTDLDKGANKRSGYVPDYSVWHMGYPVLVAEAKSPEETAESGLREARLYSIEINKRYPHDINPVQFILATNGRTLLVSQWDSEDVLEFSLEDLGVGTANLDSLRDLLGRQTVTDHASRVDAQLHGRPMWLPVTKLKGQKTLQEPLGFNSFADDLLPLIDKYFGKESQENESEIVRRAYVSSDETTRYHHTLETYLRDKVFEVERGDAEKIVTTKRSEEKLTKNINRYATSPAYYGRIQLLIGAVGAGKSTFIKRYYEHLCPREIREKTLWSFVNFNNAPNDLADAERWLAQAFIDSFVTANGLESIYAEKNLRRVFSVDIARRMSGPYASLAKNQPDELERRLSADIANWMDDPINFAKNICRYYIGDRRTAVVVFIDNVDRRDREQQLRIFQVAQWFKDMTRSFCLLTLRDVTFETFKNEPPLNAFSNAVNFYITSPRFTDVVRKRLDLVIEYLSEHADERLVYTVETGAKIVYPSTDLGRYLLSLYLTLFHKRRRIAGTLEALSGKDVRRALAMFSDIIVSKHLSDSMITKVVSQPQYFDVAESTVIRIIMRTRYKYFSEANGYVANVLDADPNCNRPSNFLIIELLEFLISGRKVKGDVGLEGYFSVRSILENVQKLGFFEEDVFLALQHLLKRGLISSDH